MNPHRIPGEVVPDLVTKKTLAERTSELAARFVASIYGQLAILAALFMASCFGCDVAVTYKHLGLGIGCGCLALGFGLAIPLRCISKWG